MKEKTLYVVIADPWNEDDDFVICAICDDVNLADRICNNVSQCSRVYKQVYVSDYPLNKIVTW